MKKILLFYKKLTLNTKISQIVNKNNLITLLLLLTLILYLYNYEICYLIYNAEGLVGKERQEILKNFWRLRFSNYSLIICVLYSIQKLKLNRLNKMIVSVGFNLTLMSCVDKFLFKEFDFSEYDSMFIFIVILIEVIKYVRFRQY